MGRLVPFSHWGAHGGLCGRLLLDLGRVRDMRSIRECVKRYGDDWRAFAPKAFYARANYDTVRDRLVMNSETYRAVVLLQEVGTDR